MVVSGRCIIIILIICYIVIVSIIVIKIKTADEFTLSINGNPENPEMYSALLAPHSPADLAVFKHIGSTIEKKNEGTEKLPSEPVLSRTSVLMNKAHNRSFLHKEIDTTTFVQEFVKKGIPVTYFDDLNGTQSRKERNEKFLAILEKYNLIDQLLIILSEQKMTYILDRLNSSRNAYSTASGTAKLPSLRSLSNLCASLNIARARQTTNISQSTESAQHTMNVTIIDANRSILIEEINTMALVRAFQDKGITCFDGLDGTLGRQQMAERFLAILEENNNLLDQLFVILSGQGMTYVLDRLITCREAYSADKLDIDNDREIFIERNAFNSSIFDEIEKKYSGSVDQMSIVLIKIKKSRLDAISTLVSADELQEMHTTGESSSVSKAVEKSPFHQMPEDNTVSVPSK